MKNSNAVMKLLTIVLWCVVSVGCVAEEVKQPAVSAEVIAPAKNEIEDKGSELSFTGKVESIDSHCYGSGPCYLFVNNIGVKINRGARSSKIGHVHWPDGMNDKVSLMLGRDFDISCKKIDAKWLVDSEKFNIKNACTLEGNEKYHVDFK